MHTISEEWVQKWVGLGRCLIRQTAHTFVKILSQSPPWNGLHIRHRSTGDSSNRNIQAFSLSPQDIRRQTKLKETSLLLEHFKRHQDTDYTYTDKSSCRTLHWTPGEPGKLPFGVFQGTPGNRQHRNRQAFHWSCFWEPFMGHEQTDYIDIQTSLAKAITLRVPEENTDRYCITFPAGIVQLCITTEICI